MKIFTCVMIYIVSVFLLSACFASPATPGLEPDETGTGKWQSYTSARYQFSIRYPPGWQVIEPPTPEYPAVTDQVWLVSESLPLPQTGSRADIVLIFTQQDPSLAWEPQYFDDYRSDAFVLGDLQARRISGINKESKSPEIVVLAKVGDHYLQALPNHGEDSLEYFDQVVSSFRLAQPAAPDPTSTPTLIPSPTQSPTSTPETGAAGQRIEPANAAQLVELAKFGKGTILSLTTEPEGTPVYSPDGLWMAIPTSAGIYIYDALALEELYRIPVDGSFIFSPDGSLLAASGFGAVSLWDPATGASTGELRGNPEDYYRGLAFSPDGSLLSVGSWNREISVWSMESKELLFTISGDRLRFSPDGDLAVVVVYGENRVHLYEVRGGTEVNKWNVRNAGFAPDGQLWLEDGESVRLVDINRDQVTAPYPGIQPSFSADGNLMALFADGQVWLYDLQKGRRTQMLEGSYEEIDSLLFSPDGQTLAGSVYTLHCPTCTEIEGLDRARVLWNAADGSIINQVGYAEPPGWMAYSTEGSSLAVMETESVQIIHTADGSTIKRIDGFTNPVEGMSLSPDGKTLAAVHAAQGYTLRLWDIETGHVIRTLQNQQGAALSNVEVSYSPDEKFIAVGGDLWDLSVGERLDRIEQAIGEKTSCWPSSVAFSPQGSILATGCYEGQLDLWSIPGGDLIKSFGGYQSSVSALAYSPDGEHLAAVYWVPDYLVQVWHLPEGKASYKLTGGDFSRVAFSPDGESLATVAVREEYGHYGQQAGVVQLWNAANGKEIANLGLEDAVSIAFSADSRILATGSVDGTVRLWEIAGNGLLLDIAGRYGSVQRLAFTPDRTRLVAGSLDGTILVWGISAAASP